MKISSTLTEKEQMELLKSFYEYFENPRDFELFLKDYLLRMGLDEVETTRYTKDGGIDLYAIRKGFGDFGEADITKYYIQAKRNNYKNSIGSKLVNELKGIIPFGHKGIFITTSKFTTDAIKVSNNDPSKPVVLVNGIDLINSCIDNEIGFIYKPLFSKDEMDTFTKKIKTKEIDECVDISNENYIEKQITKNDIRARIISIPSSIVNKLNMKKGKYKVIVNNEKEYILTYSEDRKYFAGVTNLFKDFYLVNDDGVGVPKLCKWGIKDNKDIVMYIS